MADPFAQSVMISVGSAIFEGGLAFFLLRILHPDDFQSQLGRHFLNGIILHLFHNIVGIHALDREYRSQCFKFARP